MLLAGDHIAGHDRGSAARLAPMLAPLKHLSAPLGTVAVLGNHDWWTGAPDVVAALEAAGVAMADNRVVRRILSQARKASAGAEGEWEPAPAPPS